MDPFYEALSLFRRRKYDRCAEICTEILDKQPLDQAAWCLKMRALTQRVHVDDLEDEDAIGGEEDFLDDHAMASAPRPGTSMKTSSTATANGNPLRSHLIQCFVFVCSCRNQISYVVNRKTVMLSIGLVALISLVLKTQKMVKHMCHYSYKALLNHHF